MNILDIFLTTIRTVIALLGVTIIVTSAFDSIAQFLKKLIKNKQNIADTNRIRLELGHGIILGLEFIVAADVIESVIRPDYYEVGLLAVLVIIRTLLSYFLSKELLALEPQEQNS
jgi:uncharacterized membrane protein